MFRNAVALAFVEILLVLATTPVSDDRGTVILVTCNASRGGAEAMRKFRHRISFPHSNRKRLHAALRARCGVSAVATAVRTVGDVERFETPYSWFERQRLERAGTGIVQEHYSLVLAPTAQYGIKLLAPASAADGVVVTTARSSFAVSFEITGMEGKITEPCKVVLLVNNTALGSDSAFLWPPTLNPTSSALRP